MTNLDLDRIEARAKEIGPTSIAWKAGSQTASNLLDLVALARQQAATIEKLEGAGALCVTTVEALVAQIATLAASRDNWSERYGADVAKLRAENGVMRTLLYASRRKSDGEPWTPEQLHEAMYGTALAAEGSAR